MQRNPFSLNYPTIHPIFTDYWVIIVFTMPFYHQPIGFKMIVVVIF